MRSIRARLAALFVATIGFMVCLPHTSKAEVGGFHVNLTPYAGFATWAKDVNLQDKLLWGGRLGLGFSKTIVIEGSYGMSATDTQEGAGAAAYVQSVAGSPSGADFTHMAGDLQINLAPSSSVNPYIFGGYGSHQVDIEGGTDETYSGPNFGGGFKLHFSPRTALRLEARDMMFNFTDEEQLLGAPDESQHNLVYTGGLQFSLGGSSEVKDADMDGVEDKKDECPNTPAGCVVDVKGCPVDSDGDGICDGIDMCPGTMAGVKVDEKGCPGDSDGDGVFDGPDQCANTPAGCQVDANGCPLDSDKDGVCDGLDQCANTPAGLPVDANGCHTVTPEEKELLDTGVITASNIYFDTAKATIKPESEEALRKICAALQRYPSLKIEIGGHTDSQGKEAYNQKLSEQRAAAVAAWGNANCSGLVPGNVTSAGYGELKPIAPNDTKEGRAQNRRVEFRVTNMEELKQLHEVK